MIPNPWVLVGFLAALIGAFLLGVHMEHGRFMGFVSQVEAAGELAAKEAARRTATAMDIQKEKQHEHETNMRRTIESLRHRLRDAGTVGSVVPAARRTAEGGAGGEDGRLCFSREQLRERLDASMARFEERYLALVERGANALVTLNTCAGWAQRVHQHAGTNLRLRLSSDLLVMLPHHVADVGP